MTRTIACAWLLVTASVVSVSLPTVPDHFGPPPAIVPDVRDVDTYAAIIGRLQAGEPYYEAVGAELRARGYAIWPVVNWRTPVHLTTVAHLGIEWSGTVLTVLALVTLAIATLAGLRHSVWRGGASTLLVMGAMLPAIISRPGGVLMPEVPAGVLIGVSLACYGNRWWRGAALLGVAAVFVRELAAAYGLVCGLLALHARRKDESRIWLVGGVLYVIYYTWHAWQAGAHARVGDAVSAHSWLQFLGLPFLLHTLNRYGWLLLLPPACTAIAFGIGMLAWAAPSMPAQLRAAGISYAALFLVAGQPFDVYWGLLTSPIWALTFVYAREGAMRIATEILSPGSGLSSAGMSPGR